MRSSALAPSYVCGLPSDDSEGPGRSSRTSEAAEGAVSGTGERGAKGAVTASGAEGGVGASGAALVEGAALVASTGTGCSGISISAARLRGGDDVSGTPPKAYSMKLWMTSLTFFFGCPCPEEPAVFAISSIRESLLLGTRFASGSSSSSDSETGTLSDDSPRSSSDSGAAVLKPGRRADFFLLLIIWCAARDGPASADWASDWSPSSAAGAQVFLVFVDRYLCVYPRSCHASLSSKPRTRSSQASFLTQPLAFAASFLCRASVSKQENRVRKFFKHPETRL